MPREQSKQGQVLRALSGLVRASRERIGIRLRLQGSNLNSKQVGHALKALGKLSYVRKAEGVGKGPNVQWEITPGAQS